MAWRLDATPSPPINVNSNGEYSENQPQNSTLGNSTTKAAKIPGPFADHTAAKTIADLQNHAAISLSKITGIDAVPR
jgi:hypothetical protein